MEFNRNQIRGSTFQMLRLPGGLATQAGLGAKGQTGPGINSSESDMGPTQRQKLPGTGKGGRVK